MIERQSTVLEKSARPSPERTPNVVSFGNVDHMIAELVARPPDENLVRVDTCLRDSEGGSPGIRLRTASVLITARRRDEVLVANMVHSYFRAFHNQPLVERDRQLAKENDRTVLRVLEEQLEEQGFIIGRGSYAVPEQLAIYRATSERIVFKNRKAYARAEVVTAMDGNSKQKERSAIE